MPYVRSEGGDRFYFEQRGAGGALVLIPGLAIDISELGPLIEALAQRFSVTAVDNLGAGRSDRPDRQYSLEGMGGGASGLLRSRLGPAAVMGISLGSRIALALALRRPELVSRLVLVSGGARVRRSFATDVLMSTVPRVPVGKGRYPQPYYAFRRQRLASQGIDLRGDLALISAPTLIAHGTRDRIAPRAFATELRDGIPHSRLEWFDGGHTFPLGPAGAHWLAETTAAFVDETRPGGGGR